MGTAPLLGVLEEAQARGFLGPGPVALQLAHSESLAAALGPFGGTFLDLGSGGGIPGLVLASAWPEARGYLLDAQARRCEFLGSALRTLELAERIEVECGRAERLAREPGLRGQFDLVVARSFGAPAVTAECAVGFLRSGGRLVVTEPPESEVSDRAERWPAAEVERLGFSSPTSVRHRDAGAVVLRLEHDVDDRWPRREGIPNKRPLWRAL